MKKLFQKKYTLSNEKDIYQTFLGMPDGRTPDKKDWAHLSKRWQQQLDQQQALSSCIYSFEGYQQQQTKREQQTEQLKQKQQEQEKATAKVEQFRKDYQQQQKLITEIENGLKLERDIANLQSYRDKLQADKACPLCGSTEHPAIEIYQQNNSSQTYSRLKQEKQIINTMT